MSLKYLKFSLYFVLFAFLLVSCSDSDDDDPPGNENKYLIESQKLKSYSEAEINTFLSFAKIIYPEMKDVIDEISAYVETGIDLYKIKYTTSFDGADVMASGLVSIPSNGGTYPLLSYQNGTNTLHSEAPSEDYNNQLFQILEMMASTGFILSIPDYLGFGESDDMFHPYLHKESTVESVVDMLKAVEELVVQENKVSASEDLYITGYSQGGWSTMQVQKAIEQNYANDYKLKASACSAGPYNLVTLNDYITDQSVYPMPYFVGYIFNSYLNLGLSTPIDQVFQQPYADRIPNLYDGTKTGGEINAQLNTNTSEFFTADYLSNWSSDSKFAPIIDMLEENSAEAYNTRVPTLLIHGTADDYVPDIVTIDLHQEFLDAGVSSDLVRYLPLEGADHSSGIVPAGLTSLMWFLEIKGESM